MKNSIASSIVLHDLELGVHLGWSDAEQLQPQIIVADIKILFLHPPKACLTDNLSETFCYDELTQKIKLKASSKSFRLIEHLGFELYQTIKLALTHDSAVSLRITKRPPILNLKGGVSFCYGDEDIAW